MIYISQLNKKRIATNCEVDLIHLNSMIAISKVIAKDFHAKNSKLDLELSGNKEIRKHFWA